MDGSVGGWISGQMGERNNILKVSLALVDQEKERRQKEGENMATGGKGTEKKGTVDCSSQISCTAHDNFVQGQF